MSIKSIRWNQQNIAELHQALEELTVAHAMIAHALVDDSVTWKTGHEAMDACTRSHEKIGDIHRKLLIVEDLIDKNDFALSEKAPDDVRKT